METTRNKYARLEKYTLLKTLGSGYNSKVKLGYDSEADKYVAVKIIKHSHPKLNIKLIKKEIDILSKLNHPNIVNLIDFIESATYVKKNEKTYQAVAIILELVSGGELFEYLADSGFFSEETARTYFKIIIETLEYCFGQGITHRDLKPENLLFDQDFHLKIADFGFATLLAGHEGNGELRTVLGTESYMAPEIHMRKPYSGTCVDLFACSIILFIMVSGTPPFMKADPNTDPYYRVLCGQRYDAFWKAHEKHKPKIEGKEQFFSEEFRNLMEVMFSLDPSKRLNIEQIKDHPWYNGPIVDKETLKVEFTKRKEKVDAELKRQREAKEKKKQEMLKKKTHQASGAFSGFQPFRSVGMELEQNITKELEDKFNLNAKRVLQEYQEKAGFKINTEVFSVIDPDLLFKLLCVICAKVNTDITVSEETYKIKARAIQDEGICNFNVVLTKVDDNMTCVEFQKTSGNIMNFYKVIDEIKKKIPSIQDEEENSPNEVEAQ